MAYLPYIPHNIHSCYIYTPSGDAVIVKERRLYSDGTSKPNLAVYENPKRSFYITKKRYQTYNFKPEHEILNRLDKFTVPNVIMKSKVAELLGIRYTKWTKDSALYKSPYIFGADITVEALIKMRYYNLANGTTVRPIVGFLDVETHIATQELIMVSFMANNRIYCSIREPWMYKVEGKNRIKVGIEELNKFVHKHLAKHTDISKYEIILKIVPTELDLLVATFKAIHSEDVDYIGMWNMHFDISRIMEAIGRTKYSCADFFCDPKLPKHLKKFRYIEDKGKPAHFTLKWHWVHTTAFSQWYDCMGLYSNNRRTMAFHGNYKLNTILGIYLKTHKMEIINDDHTYMQRQHIREYTAYNIFDVIGLHMLEEKNNDIFNMHMRTRVTPPSKFARATVMNMNDTYHQLLLDGKVLASSSSEDAFIRMEKSLFTEKAGGTVLNPTLVSDVGIQIGIGDY